MTRKNECKVVNKMLQKSAKIDQKVAIFSVYFMYRPIGHSGRIFGIGLNVCKSLCTPQNVLHEELVLPHFHYFSQIINKVSAYAKNEAFQFTKKLCLDLDLRR